MANIFDTDTARPRTPRFLWLIIAVAALAAVVAVFFLLRPQGEPAEPTPVHTTQATPAPEPHLHPHSEGAERGAWTTLNTFLNGWASTNKETRAKVFEQTTVGDLAEGLEDTSEENIITAPISGIDVISASPYSTEFRVWITGDGDPIWVLLESGHATASTPYDWRVADLERRPL